MKNKHDACYRKTMATYGGKWSARAAQSVAKCRKAHHQVRKTSAGASLRRWQAEKWKDKRTGAECGGSKNSTEYCRPTKKVSSKTPVMPRGKALQSAIRTKVSTGHAKVFKRRK